MGRGVGDSRVGIADVTRECSGVFELRPLLG